MSKLIFLFVILVAALALEASNIDYLNRGVLVSMVLVFSFLCYLLYDTLFRKRRLGTTQLILSVPVIALAVLMAGRNAFGLSQVAIWVIFAAVTVLCVGFVLRKVE